MQQERPWLFRMRVFETSANADTVENTTHELSYGRYDDVPSVREAIGKWERLNLRDIAWGEFVHIVTVDYKNEILNIDEYHYYCDEDLLPRAEADAICSDMQRIDAEIRQRIDAEIRQILLKAHMQEIDALRQSTITIASAIVEVLRRPDTQQVLKSILNLLKDPQ